MKIGPFIILERETLNPQLSTLNSAPASMAEADIRQALRVPDTEPWWVAVHQVIDEAEQETINAARASTLVPNVCAANVAAGEAMDLLRKRIVRLREEGIKGGPETSNVQRPTSNVQRR